MRVIINNILEYQGPLNNDMNLSSATFCDSDSLGIIMYYDKRFFTRSSFFKSKVTQDACGIKSRFNVFSGFSKSRPA